MVRLKTQYLVVEATGARKLTVKKEDIVLVIRESITKSYGDYGSGLAQYAFQGAWIYGWMTSERSFKPGCSLSLFLTGVVSI